jgi:hypothetical protein
VLKLKPVTDSITVPDDFTYRFPQDGFVVRHPVRAAWFDLIDRHYRDNGYEQPENWREIAEDALCRRLSGEWCTGGTPHSFVNTRFTLDDFLRGARVSLTGSLVDPATAEARALICSRCVVNVNVPGCTACSGVANLVATLKGARKTKYDHLLKACGVCKCANEAQVWYAAIDLQRGVTPEMMLTYQEIDQAGECWKYQELAGILSK